MSSHDVGDAPAASDRAPDRLEGGLEGGLGGWTPGGQPPRDARHAWARLGRAMRPSASRARAQLVTGLLCAVLGFAAVVQLRADDADLLARSRRSDLVQILDGLSQQANRLEDEIAELESSRAELVSGADRRRTALEQTQARVQALGVLAGTLPASGPGVVMRVDDPRGTIDAAVLLAAVQELRDAGAEAIEIAGGAGTDVRVVASTAFLDGEPAGVVIDGALLRPPYTITAIGDPGVLSTGLRIPGGAVEEVGNAGGRAEVQEADLVVVDALHVASTPQYARPAPEPEGDG